MNLNKKGVSLVELIASLALLSIVLTFLLNLFIKTRGLYDDSKIDAEYDMVGSTIIRSVGDDIEKYGLLSVKYKENSNNNDAIVLTFNAYRPSHLSERIQKVLKVFQDKNGHYHISYTYDGEVTNDIVNTERITNVVREVPESAILEITNFIQLDSLEDKFISIKIPISNQAGIKYDISICGLLARENADG